ncbi:ChbG/HpnK family deacetylase [Vibrio sp. S9_S30]|uniref:ChbG/HpnK family deacetylase n=1 Tax=Vibrio sp. S9_S30 TaxID=2720226 RepID=UPI0016815C6A|nr:ChbG/HpnK family deacetylase [Vibrio sp. S9_S30]MBD1556529.1 ChbG/HpnK family deacetylase [Vibrio sp. S9_S30]
MKSIIVCADDYGMSDDVDDAILELIENQRISATSCMTLMPSWKASARRLKELEGQAAFGLHFDLGHFASLSNLMLGAMTRTLDQSAMKVTLNQQLDNFENEVGRVPDYIDGHQHVHSFPVIRDVLVSVINQRYSTNPPWIRTPSVPLSGHDSALKALVIKGLNIGFNSIIRERTSAKTNTSFAGLYSISETANFPALMEGWVNNLDHHGLIMCHPAIKRTNVDHGLARVKEYEYLRSDRYIAHLDTNNVTLITHPE